MPLAWVFVVIMCGAYNPHCDYETAETVLRSPPMGKHACDAKLESFNERPHETAAAWCSTEIEDRA